MKGKIFDFVVGFQSKQMLLLELDGDFRNDYDKLKDRNVEIVIKRYRKKRSLDANAYAWVLLDKLSAVLEVPKEEIYRHTVMGIGGVSEVVCVQNRAVKRVRAGWEGRGLGWQVEEIPSQIKECTNLVLYMGSSEYDTEQMSRLIDLIVQDCQEQGIETKTHEELDKLKGDWT